MADATPHTSNRRPKKRMLHPIRKVGKRLTRGFSSRDSSIVTLQSEGVEVSLDEHENASTNYNDSNINDNATTTTAATIKKPVPQSSTTKIVVKAELVLRWIGIVLIAYMVGVQYPQARTLLSRLLEYAIVAWITCKSILYATTHVDNEQATFKPEKSMSIESELCIPNLENELDDNDAVIDNIAQTRIAVQSDTAAPKPLDTTSKAPTEQQLESVHPDLEKLVIIDALKMQRVMSNDVTNIHQLECDYFTGTMLGIIRTPDVDDSTKPATTGNAWASEYLSNKKRRFEFQFQLKVKKLPKPGNVVYVTCELDESVKLGLIQRAFVSAAMTFVKQTNKSFSYSVAGQAPREDGVYEKPHMAFPVDQSMDRVIETPPGESPPQLGQELFEDPESISFRKKGGKIDFKIDHTYTLALWTAYTDFLEWKCMNIPGIRPFSLNSVIGDQAMHILLYELPGDKHYQRDMEMMVHLELSNKDHTRMGKYAKMWQQNHKQTAVANDPTKYIISEDPISPPIAYESSVELVVHREQSVSDMSLPELHTTSGRDRTVSESIFEIDDENSGDSDEEVAVAELGEGMYVRSGDKVTLRESSLQVSLEDNQRSSSFVTMGGGFAIVQEKNSSTIVIEKVGRKHKGTKLIKSGDTVRIKLMTRKGEDEEIRYLSTHRGWWLKWVALAPNKNGNFTIHTHETEYDDQDRSKMAPPETQSSYLTIGGSFWLRHKRWSKFLVGVAAEGSATYGGRMLGLYLPSKDPESALKGGMVNYISDDEGRGENNVDSKNRKGYWLKPLQLRAYESYTSTVSIGNRTYSEEAIDDAEQKQKDSSAVQKLTFSKDDYRVDVPVWLEVLNRTDRVCQLIYGVRITPPESSPQTVKTTAFDGTSEELQSTDFDTIEEESKVHSFMRLRTGLELAQIMRVGLNWRNNEGSNKNLNMSSNSEPLSPRNQELSPGVQVASPNSKRSPLNMPRAYKRASSADAGLHYSSLQGATTNYPRNYSFHGELPTNATTTDASKMQLDQKLQEVADDNNVFYSSLNDQRSYDQSSVSDDADSADDLSKADSEEWEGASIEDMGDFENNASSAKSHGKGRKLIGKIAKSVKNRTSHTGKTMVQRSVMVGKGTVSAGKAIIAPIRPKNPPHKEPKAMSGRRARRRQERGLHVAVSRSMKKMEKRSSAILSREHDSPSFLAGELSALEQSCRTVSKMLARMSGISKSSALAETFSKMLADQFEKELYHDTWFLHGDATQLGVVPDKSDVTRGKLRSSFVVARCLWESHWREEWVGLYDKCISVYAPLTHQSCLEIQISDIKTIREVSSDYYSPLAGLPILVVETAWLCYYFALSDSVVLKQFQDSLEELVNEAKKSGESSHIGDGQDASLRNAHLWQGFQSSIESGLSSGRGKWAEVLSGTKNKRRIILNNRRMEFDLYLDWNREPEGVFVQNLLSQALSLSLETLTNNPDVLVKFLDSTSQLRTFKLHKIDLSSPSALCMFVNLYHCLLQHAMLFSVSGPLNKRSSGHLMRTSCYEIGGDIFSLAELYSCIIRGKLAKPIATPKAPFFEASRKSLSYKYYALGYTTPLVNFVLNTGHCSSPRQVFVLNTQDLDSQLVIATRQYMEHNMIVDVNRRMIFLPKIMEVYRADFTATADNNILLQFCVDHSTENVQMLVQQIWQAEDDSTPASVIPGLSIRFVTPVDQYHSSLRLAQPELCDSIHSTLSI